MSRVMYDAIDPHNIPADAEIVASYVDNRIFPSNYDELAALFPNAKRLSICIDPTHIANILDCEQYDATPQQCPSWVALQRRNGNPYPWVYCNAATWPQVRQAFRDQNVPEPLYWIANYSSGPVIPAGAIGCQFQGTTPPGYDKSVIADHVPGLDPDPMGGLSVSDVQEILDRLDSLGAILTQGTPLPSGNTHPDNLHDIHVLEENLFNAVNALTTAMEGMAADIAVIKTKVGC